LRVLAARPESPYNGENWRKVSAIQSVVRLGSFSHMAQSSTGFGERLEAAIAQWNARLEGAFPEINATMEQITGQLSAVTETLAAQRRLPSSLLSARLALESLELTSAEREEQSLAAIRQLEALEQGLASFHIELETLVAQANRALSTGADLTNALAALQDNGGASLLKPGEVAMPHIASRNAAEWAAQVASLESQVAQLREKLAEAEAAQSTGSPMSTKAQDELVQLREEIAALREEREENPIDIPELPHSNAPSLDQLAVDEQGKKRPLGMILVRAGIINADQLEAALREQRSSWHRHIGAILIDLGFADEITIAQALAAQTKLPFVRLGNERIDRNAVKLLSRQMAHHHSSIPLREEMGKLVVAMANPLDLVALEDIQLATNRSIRPVVASVSDLRNTLREFYDNTARPY